MASAQVVKSLLTNALEQLKIQRSRLDIGILCNPAEFPPLILVEFDKNAVLPQSPAQPR